MCPHVISYLDSWGHMYQSRQQIFWKYISVKSKIESWNTFHSFSSKKHEKSHLRIVICLPFFWLIVKINQKMSPNSKKVVSSVPCPHFQSNKFYNKIFRTFHTMWIPENACFARGKFERHLYQALIDDINYEDEKIHLRMYF